MSERHKKILFLAGKMSDAARAVVGGQGINFRVLPAHIDNLSELCIALRKAVDAYDAELIRMKVDDHE